MSVDSDVLLIRVKAMEALAVKTDREMSNLKSKNARLLNENIALRAGKIADEDIQRIASNIGFHLDRFYGLPINGDHITSIGKAIKEEFGS